jgi:hypothetical protein
MVEVVALLCPSTVLLRRFPLRHSTPSFWLLVVVALYHIFQQAREVLEGTRQSQQQDKNARPFQRLQFLLLEVGVVVQRWQDPLVLPREAQPTEGGTLEVGVDFWETGGMDTPATLVSRQLGENLSSMGV